MSFITFNLENPLFNILVRFLLNLAVLFTLVRFIYYRYSQKEEYLFSFIMMGIIIFFVCSILKTVDIHLGMALGLFAIFALLRFRTVTYTVKDITYIFTVIGISVINSMANIPPPVVGALVVNCVILIASFSLEIFYQKKVKDSFIIIYNKPEWLVPAFKKELLEDLSACTGQDIIKVKIHKFNIGTGNAEIEVFFREKKTDEVSHL
jgi:hypothetical protein